MLPPPYEATQQAVVVQPGASGFVNVPVLIPAGGPNVVMTGMWMQMPAPIPGCPTGLEYLHALDQLVCHQKVDVAEIFVNWECANRYAILTKQGQQVYYAFEESDMCLRQLCKNQRSFVLHIVNNLNQEVFTIRRPLKFCADGCCWCAFSNCCSQELSVYLPDGIPLGHVQQGCACCSHEFRIYDGNRQHQLTVTGRAIFACCSVEYQVKSRDGKLLGKIQKKFSGVGEEFFTNADKFGVQFPEDLDVKLKAVLIGAMFLIDFMVFEADC